MLAADLIINKILQNKDLNIVKTNGLEGKHFQNREPEFNYIMDHYRQYGNVPDPIVLLSHFPEFDLIQVNESDDFLVNKLFEEYGFTKFTEMLPQLNQKLKEDSRVAYEYLKVEMETTLKPRVMTKGHDIIEDALERYEAYLDKQKLEANATISTGFPELDEIFNGWEYGEELVTIVARTNNGKSWILMKFLTEAWKQGKRVGVYSGEMSHIKLGYRFDALFGEISNRALVRGNPLPNNRNYKEYIDSLKGSPGCFKIYTQDDFGGRPTVQQIANYVEKDKLDIVGIDQLSLMEDGRAKKNDQTRMRLAHIAEDLFLLSSEYKIPVLALAQANRAGINKDDSSDAPGLENIKESDDIAHNSSKCIGMRQVNGTLILDIIKNREGRVGDKLRYEWDIDVGHFNYLPAADDAVSSETRETVVKHNKTTMEAAISKHPF